MSGPYFLSITSFDVVSDPPVPLIFFPGLPYSCNGESLCQSPCTPRLRPNISILHPPPLLHPRDQRPTYLKRKFFSYHFHSSSLLMKVIPRLNSFTYQQQYQQEPLNPIRLVEVTTEVSRVQTLGGWEKTREPCSGSTYTM